MFILGKTPQIMNHFSSVVRIRTKSEITVILSAPTTTNSQLVLMDILSRHGAYSRTSKFEKYTSELQRNKDTVRVGVLSAEVPFQDAVKNS